MTKSVLDIDVGGTKVRTTTATLNQLPFLEALLRYEAAGTMNVTKNDDGVIFIDRSHELFVKILDGLRAGGTIFAESASEASQLLAELAFWGAKANCPTLSAWEQSEIDEVIVRWGSVQGAGPPTTTIAIVCASHVVLNEVLPVLGHSGVTIDDFNGHRMVALDCNRGQINPQLLSNGCISSEIFTFRLGALLSKFGFVVTSQFGGGRDLSAGITFSRKKLFRERPFVIKVESHEDPFQIGVSVLTHSLGKADLNDVQGTIVRFQGDRVVVLGKAIGEKAFKRDNLMLDTFQIGAKVLAHSLATTDLNGVQGTVVGHQGDHVLVAFEESIGEKALKRNNLKLNDAHDVDIAVATIYQPCAQSARQEPVGDTDTETDRFDGVGVSIALTADIEKTYEADAELQEVIQQSEQEAAKQENADIAQALFQSTFEHQDGIILRLTHSSQEIRETLLTTDLLSNCRNRVTEAGCELSPDWGNEALFLLPFREQSEFEELQLQGISLEKLKHYNIVALRDDEDLIRQALTQVPRRRRPQCKREGSGLACTCDDPDVVGSANVLDKPSEAMLETGTSESAPEVGDDIKIEIERTFLTFKPVHESSASSMCRSAP